MGNLSPLSPLNYYFNPQLTVKVKLKYHMLKLHLGIPRTETALNQYKCQSQFLAGSFRSSSQIHYLGYLPVKPRDDKPIKREFIIIVVLAIRN